MNASTIDIAPYVNIIRQCRKYETQTNHPLPETDDEQGVIK